MLNLSKNRQEKKSVHFYIIDNDASFANKLSRSLSNDPDYKIDTFYNKDEFMESYNSVVLRKRKEKINIVIIDSNQLDQPNDLELIHTIKQNLKNTEIIILTEEENTNIGSDVLQSGVYSVIPKNDNIFYRIENSAKGIKSLKNFMNTRKIMLVSLAVFMGFIIAIGILFFILMLSS